MKKIIRKWQKMIKECMVKVRTSNNENLRPDVFNTTDDQHRLFHSHGNQNGSGYEGDDISSRKSGVEIDALVESRVKY